MAQNKTWIGDCISYQSVHVCFVLFDPSFKFGCGLCLAAYLSLVPLSSALVAYPAHIAHLDPACGGGVCLHLDSKERAPQTA